MFKKGDKVICVSAPDETEVALRVSDFVKVGNEYTVLDTTHLYIGIKVYDRRRNCMDTLYFLPKNFVISMDSKAAIRNSILSGDLFKT